MAARGIFIGRLANRPRAAKVEIAIPFLSRAYAMRLNRTTLYGVAAVLQLSDDKKAKPLSCRQLCEQSDMPERYLLQILRKLAIAGVVNSTRGVDGGYRLARPLKRISLLDIVEAVDELPSFNVDTLDGLSAAAHWAIGDAMAAVDKDVRKRLGAFTLDKLTGVK